MEYTCMIFFRIDTMTQFTESIGKKAFFYVTARKTKKLFLKGQNEAIEKILKTYFNKESINLPLEFIYWSFLCIHKHFFQSYLYFFFHCVYEDELEIVLRHKKSFFCRYMCFSSIERNVENKEKEEKENIKSNFI